MNNTSLIRAAFVEATAEMVATHCTAIDPAVMGSVRE
jgi:hypothetical protein